MGFMQPFAERMAMYHVETNEGTELVPEDVCGKLMHDSCDEDVCDVGQVCTDCAWQLRDYLEGSKVYEYSRKEGWYARLSAPGYLDCTGWDGPHDTAELALAAVKDFYEVDDNGDDLPEEA